MIKPIEFVKSVDRPYIYAGDVIGHILWISLFRQQGFLISSNLTFFPFMVIMSGYKRLPHNGDITDHSYQRSWIRKDIIYIVLSTSILFLWLGLSIGRNIRPLSQHSTSPVTDTTLSVFTYNETFTEAPSLDTNAAWASLIPCRLRVKSITDLNILMIG